MSVLSDFEKLSPKTKSIGLSIIALFPFSLFSVYLFYKPLAESENYVWIITGASCIVLGCYGLNYFLTFISLKVLKEKLTKTETDKSFAYIGFFSGLNFCYWMLMSYRQELPLGFFLTGVFGFPFMASGLLIFVRSSQRKKQNNNK